MAPKHNPHPPEEESSLRGTFASVLILGALIVGSWAAAFWLYLSRG